MTSIRPGLRRLSVSSVTVLLLAVLIGCNGSGAVSPASRERACAPDRQVYEALLREAALQQRLAGAEPRLAGIAPEFDSKTRECSTTFRTFRWDVADTDEASGVVEGLSRALSADGWTEVTGTNRQLPPVCGQDPGSALCSPMPLPPLLRGFSKVVGGHDTPRHRPPPRRRCGRGYRPADSHRLAQGRPVTS